MRYRIVDSRYYSDNGTLPLFASNDKQEAIVSARESGQGMIVVRTDECGLEEIVFVSKYNEDAGIPG